MKSISTRLSSAVTGALIALFAVVSLIYSYNLYHVNLSNSERRVWEICHECKDSFDSKLRTMEIATDMVSHHTRYYVNNEFESEDIRLGKFEASALHTVSYVDKIYSLYYYANPLRFDDRYNFYYYCDTAEGVPVKQPKRSIAGFEKQTGQRADWYYESAERLTPVWLEPYDVYAPDGKITKVMAYSIPLFNVHGVLNGVMGIELSLDSLVAEINRVKLFNNGYIFVTNSAGTILAHPKFAYGTTLEDVNAINWTEVENMLNNPHSEHLISYKLHGEERCLAALRLENNMVMLASVPKSEVDFIFTSTQNKSTFGFIIIILITTTFMLTLIHRYLAPIKKLSELSQRLIDGESTVDIEYSGDDEIGILTENFRKMAFHLNERLTHYSTLAYTDVMTGVKNKASYEMYISVLDDDIKAGRAKFGVVVIDLNNLKEVNDAYGHEEGDRLIKAVTELMSRSFSNSPIFRIGGDEFTVLLDGDDYDNFESRFAHLDRLVAEANLTLTSDKRISFARGCTLYDADTDDSYLDVFIRADKLMYENKYNMKKS